MPHILDVSSLSRHVTAAWWAARLGFVFAFGQFITAYVVLAFATDYEMTPRWLAYQMLMLAAMTLGWSMIGAPIRTLRWPALAVLLLIAAILLVGSARMIAEPEIVRQWSARFPDPKWHHLALQLGPDGPVIVALAWIVPFALIATSGAAAALRLRFRRTPGFGATLLTIDTRTRVAIASWGDAPNLVRLLRWSQWQGWLAGLAAVSVLMLPAFLPGRESSIPRTGGADGWVADKLAWLLTYANDRVAALLPALVVALLLWRLARRYLNPEARYVLAMDRRAPILLLRSFADDLAAVPPTALWRRLLHPLLFWLGGISRKRLEEVAGQSLARLGPFIAVADPREKLRYLGAFRAELADDEWQDYVRCWMREARVIVMIAGTTPSFTWELNTAMELGLADKLLLLMPPGSAAAIDARWHHAQRSLAANLHDAMSGTDPSNVLAVHFTRAGEVAMLVANRRREVDYDLAIRLGVASITTRPD